MVTGSTLDAPQRLTWAQLPDQVRAAAEAALGAPVVTDSVQTGGFSPGLASRLQLADGRRVFAKAIAGHRDPHAPGLYRREAAVAAALPASVPAPALRWVYDDGDWVMLVFDDVEGRSPAEPWDRGELRRVVTAVEALALELTPSPLPAVPVAEDLGENFASWRALAAGPGPVLDRLDPWARAHLEQLVGLEAGWGEPAAGDTLVHADLRADNILLTGAPGPGGVMIVDWPYAVAGAAWLDLLLFLPSVAATTPVDLETVWVGHPPARAADPAGVTAVLAALAGDFLAQSLRPAPANLPTLRAHQAAKGAAALRWLRTRLGA